jgi:hypothetical protein
MRFGIAGLLVALTTVTAQAQTVYTNRTSFNSHSSIVKTETFESLGKKTTLLNGPITLPSGVIISSLSNHLFTAGPGQSTNPSTAIGTNVPSLDALQIGLPGVFHAIGLDIYQNFGGGFQLGSPVPYIISLFKDAQPVGSFITSVASNGGSFFGVVTSLGFNKVSVLGLIPSYEVVDNVAFGNALAAPGPVAGTGVIPLLGLAGYWMARRRRRQLAA